MKSDEQLLLEHARKEIQGRIDYWKTFDRTAPLAAWNIIANLEWSLAQLDSHPGRIMALRQREKEND